MLVNIRNHIPEVYKNYSDIDLLDIMLPVYLDKGVQLDLRFLNFSTNMSASGSPGMLYKACTNNYYFKLSTFSEYSPDTYGYESVCEIIASRLCNLFGFSNANYKPLNALINIGEKEYELWLCVSENFRMKGDKRTTLENLIKLDGRDTLDLESNFQFCLDKPYSVDIMSMLLIDYIIDNRDRHGANIELLVNTKGIRLAPIYDCGFSLLSTSLYDINKMKKFKPLHDGPVNNFLISMFWEDVIRELSKHYKVPIVDIDELFLDDLIPCFKENGELILCAMKNMISRRYNYVKEICDT